MTPPRAIELLRLRLPLRRPLAAAHGAEVVREVTLVRLTDHDGNVGWGECSALQAPTYTAEYAEGAWRILVDLLGPATLDGIDPGFVGHPMAMAAVRTAVLDAALRGRQRSLAAHLGSRVGKPRDRVQTCAVMGRAGSVEDLLAQVAVAISSGASLIKVKVSPHADDLDAVAVVRRTWPEVPVAVDGNGSLDARSLSILDSLGLAYIEQPAPAADLVASAGHASRLETPIALDESIDSLGALDAATALGAGAIVNIKPARVGGPEAAVDLAVRAAEQGWAGFCGGMLETGVGRAAALAVAAMPILALPTDLGPSSRYFDVDITPSFDLDDQGTLAVPSGPGIGIEPDAGRLAAVVVDRVALGA